MLKSTYLIINARSNTKTYGIVKIELRADKKIVLCLAKEVMPRDIVKDVIAAVPCDIIEVWGGGHLVVLLRAELAKNSLSIPVEELSCGEFDHVFVENLALLMKGGQFIDAQVDRSAWKSDLDAYVPDQAGKRCILVEAVAQIVGILRRDGWPDPDLEDWDSKKKRMHQELSRLDQNSRDFWIGVEELKFNENVDTVFEYV